MRRRIIARYPNRAKQLGFLILRLLVCAASPAWPKEVSAVHKRFSEELWEDIHPTYQSILAHPFLQGLADGTLPEQAFRYYMVQDALYLRDFARALALVSAKSPKDSWSALFAEHARGALEEEKSLHESFFKEWGLKDAEVYGIPMSPTNLAYTSYLLRTGSEGTFEELLGAILPCYWTYGETGKALKARGSPNPLYRRWIDAYSSREYEATVREIIATLDQAAADLPESRKAAIRRRFFIASRYEWMFWDSAWRQEAWPRP